jgi:hypothetical protein
MVTVFKQFFDLLDDLEEYAGKNDKRRTLKIICENPVYKEIVGMCLNPRFPMYIGPEAKLHNDMFAPVEDEDHITPDLLIELMKGLNNGTIKRGDEAASRVGQFIEGYTGDMKRMEKWVSRLVRKDLKAGVSYESFSKVTGVSKFEVMLAKDIKKVIGAEEKFKGTIITQPKLDGYRCVAIHDNEAETWKLYSRNGKEYNNFPQLVKALNESYDLPYNYVLDGEVMSDDFQAMQRTAFSDKKKSVVGDLYYAIFDLVTIAEWLVQEGEHDTVKRYSTLKNLFDKGILNNKIFRRVPSKVCNSLEEAYAMHPLYIEKGYEGTMLRANAPYQFKRTDYLAKVKDMLSQDCTIKAISSGMRGTKLENTLGSITVIQENKTICDVGSGFSDELRNDLWSKRDKLIGKVIEVKYQELTKDGIMRFPVFMRFREDKEERILAYHSESECYMVFNSYKELEELCRREPLDDVTGITHHEEAFKRQELEKAKTVKKMNKRIEAILAPDTRER